MFNVSKFHDLVSGRRRGIQAMLCRAMLGVAELPYAAAVSWRNWRFDASPKKIHRVDVPVISVGNLTTGGTGKTPMVEHIARWYRENNIRVTLVSRGYGAEEGSRNDEALELEQKLPDVPHLQNPDRVAAARTAIEELDSQLILLDDAFQHRRIHRDLDVVLLDATEPFGFDHLLPRGLLRESLSGLARADLVALSRADMVDEEQRQAIRKKVQRYAPDAGWLELAHRPRALLSSQGQTSPLDRFSNRRVAAFCGIGNPAGFRHTLAECGYEVVDFREFPDHHPYRREDIESLTAWSDSLNDIEAVICTHKDLVKIGAENLGGHPLWAIRVELDVVAGRDLLEQRLQSLLAPPSTADASV